MKNSDMMISRRLASGLATVVLAAALCGACPYPAFAANAPVPAGNPQVRFTTSAGSWVVELYPDRAPITVAEFLRYVKEGQYTQTLLHRVIPDF